MTAPLGMYSFLPWLRHGVAGTITAQDLDTGVKLRTTLHVDVTISGDRVDGEAGAVTQTIGRDVELFGPGDIVGIESRAIVRTEPRDWVTNFEPNYLAAIEFYDEDFPWRYTPAAPDGTRLRLRPWIMLVVLRESEFKAGANPAGRPLPSITVADPAVFPPAAELWAWAHVHVNRSLAASDEEFVSGDTDAVLPRLDAVLAENPDLAYSRIVCPRRLAPDTAYHAFLLPVFESGRLAGLGLDPAGVPYATASAWEAYAGRPEATSYPVYHRWYFRTGAQGDFEYLVRLLEAKPVDPRVGVRDVDVLHPGAPLPPIDDLTLGGVLRLGGALRIPRRILNPAQRAEAERYENWPAAGPRARTFQDKLAAFANLADDYQVQAASAANAASGLGESVERDKDPVVTIPIYGLWHALTRRLRVDHDGNPLPRPVRWAEQLNLDPRHRMAAAFGTRVVQRYQEDYMRAAWEQVGEVLEANRRIRAAQLARDVAGTYHARHLAPLVARRAERAFTITAPAHRHIVADGRTIQHRKRSSRVSATLTSVAMRRLTRPGSRLMRRLAFDAAHPPDQLLRRVNANKVSAAPPKQTPSRIPTVERVADGVVPAGAPPVIVHWLRRFPGLPAVLLLLALAIVVAVVLLLPVGLGLALGVAVALVIAWFSRRWRGWRNVDRRADGLRPDRMRSDLVDDLPSDRPEAGRFKMALRQWWALHAAGVEAARRPEPVPLDLPSLTKAAVATLNPAVTIPSRIAHSLQLPPRIVEGLQGGRLEESFTEVMAYPEIDAPMYQPLVNLSSDLFLPNLNLIPPNSITLLETNQEFIEAYMVGLNHEFARELLWREYPTDQRGSYFRQFWDVRTVTPAEGQTEEVTREALRDIPPIHQWSRRSRLGEHDHREAGRENDAELVLVIRGELLKKYPTAVIYAHAARWQPGTNTPIDPGKERELVPLLAEEESHPPSTKLRTPLYEAKIDPDIYLFGFDLTVKVAKGGTGEHPEDPAGWFFVIRERPGEPRFGFDVNRQGPIQTFNDVAWDDVLPGGAPGAYIAAASLATLNLQPPGPAEEEKTEQHADDANVNASPVSAARWAYILYQAPMLVAVHAAEMLTPKS